MGAFGGKAIYRLAYKTFCKLKRALRTNAENNVDRCTTITSNQS